MISGPGVVSARPSPSSISRAREPAVGLDRALRHVGQHRVGAAEGDDRRLAEEQAEPREHVGRAEQERAGSGRHRARAAGRSPSTRSARPTPRRGRAESPCAPPARRERAPAAASSRANRTRPPRPRPAGNGTANRNSAANASRGDDALQVSREHAPSDPQRRLEHEREHGGLDAVEERRYRGQLAERHVDERERENRDEARQHEERSRGQPAARAVQAPAEIGRELLRLRSGQQRAERERVQEAALVDPALLVDEDAVHDGDLAGRSAEALRRRRAPRPAARLANGTGADASFSARSSARTRERARRRPRRPRARTGRARSAPTSLRPCPAALAAMPPTSARPSAARCSRGFARGTRPARAAASDTSPSPSKSASSCGATNTRSADWKRAISGIIGLALDARLHHLVREQVVDRVGREAGGADARERRGDEAESRPSQLRSPGRTRADPARTARTRRSWTATDSQTRSGVAPTCSRMNATSVVPGIGIRNHASQNVSAAATRQAPPMLRVSRMRATVTARRAPGATQPMVARRAVIGCERTRCWEDSRDVRAPASTAASAGCSSTRRACSGSRT